MLGNPKPRLKHLYRLNAYCIENLLLTEEAIIALCAISSPDTSEDDIRKQLDWDTWVSSVESKIFPLFMLYAVAFRVGVRIPLVAYAIDRLCDKSMLPVKLCSTRIRKRMYEVGRSARTAAGIADLRSRMRTCRKHCEQLGHRRHQYISGKDYIMPLLHERLRREFSFKGDKKQLKAQLAIQYDTAVEPFFARRLRSVIK